MLFIFPFCLLPRPGSDINSPEEWFVKIQKPVSLSNKFSQYVSDLFKVWKLDKSYALCASVHIWLAYVACLHQIDKHGKTEKKNVCKEL